MEIPSWKECSCSIYIIKLFLKRMLFSLTFSKPFERLCLVALKANAFRPQSRSHMSSEQTELQWYCTASIDFY